MLVRVVSIFTVMRRRRVAKRRERREIEESGG
jgi:hypothetical protein